MSSKLVPEVLGYLEQVEAGAPPACRDQVALAAYVRRCFETEDIYTDVEQLGKYLGLVKYFPFSTGLMPWEEFLLTLWDCTYWSGTRKPRWPDVFCMVGRGAGKDGFISFDAACSVSPYNPVPHYDVDICANNQDQATRPVKDLAEVLETPRFEKKLALHFYHTKELVQGIRNKGVVRGHTNNPKGRDGLRPGKIIFNEVHSYENYDNISVFTTALGKRAEPRTGYFTSNGIVSDGPLDDLWSAAGGSSTRVSRIRAYCHLSAAWTVWRRYTIRMPGQRLIRACHTTTTCARKSPRNTGPGWTRLTKTISFRPSGLGCGAVKPKWLLRPTRKSSSPTSLFRR